MVVDTSTSAGEGDLLLFVVLDPGADLDEVTPKLRALIRSELSPRHVPGAVIPVPVVPRTLNGKKCEVPVKRILAGAAVESGGVPGRAGRPGRFRFLPRWPRARRSRRRSAGDRCASPVGPPACRPWGWLGWCRRWVRQLARRGSADARRVRDRDVGDVGHHAAWRVGVGRRPPAPSAAGPTLVVTVPELPLASSSAPARPSPPVAAHRRQRPRLRLPGRQPDRGRRRPSDAVHRRRRRPTDPVPAAAEPTAEPAPPAATAAPPAPAGDQLPISLANCDGCSVLATHRGVTGDLSAALVGTQTGRADPAVGRSGRPGQGGDRGAVRRVVRGARRRGAAVRRSGAVRGRRAPKPMAGRSCPRSS